MGSIIESRVSKDTFLRKTTSKFGITIETYGKYTFELHILG
jgi:hypothetical protein